MKTILTNTTVVNKGNLFMCFKGKGKGSQIAQFLTIDEATKFDSDFKNLEYKLIIQKSTGKKGGAYFYKNTDTMFDKKHPFYNDFKIA